MLQNLLPRAIQTNASIGFVRSQSDQPNWLVLFREFNLCLSPPCFSLS